MYGTDDPVADFERYDREQARKEARMPHCDICGNAIYEEYYEIKETIICEECLEHFKHYAEDDMD